MTDGQELWPMPRFPFEIWSIVPDAGSSYLSVEEAQRMAEEAAALNPQEADNSA